MMMRSCLIAVLALGVPLAALAAEIEQGAAAQVSADSHAPALYAYETAAGMKVGAVFGVLPEVGQDDELVAAKAGQVCDHVEIHQMKEEDGIMQMRQVSSLAVREGQEDALSAHGYHLMLMKMVGPLESGKSFPLTLVFKKAGEKTIEVPVVSRQAHSAAPDDSAAHGHHQ